MTEQITKGHLLNLQNTIKSQFIEPYQNVKKLRTIQSTTKLQDSTSLKELSKLSNLMKSHATKIGIVIKPDTFDEKNYNAIFKEIKGFIDAVFFYFSLLPLFYDKKANHPEYFLVKIDGLTLDLLKGMELLCKELEEKLEDKDSDKDRLLCVGVIWACCDSLEEIATKGDFGLLADSIRGSNSLVDDVLNDIDEFLENPSFSDEMFMDDEYSSDVEESKTPEEEEALKKMCKFLESWKTNLKMIKLLLSSFVSTITNTSSRPTNYTGTVLDEFQKLHLKITEDIDTFISDVFMSDASFDVSDFEEEIGSLNVTLSKVIRVIKKINKDDNKKLKWVDVWENKYFKKE
ncbi:hypothetical protein KAFR_0A04870 [Kazachstania africana CBS 2517]|uniref:Uncharacterized protein n=1 Tax=Kazachstania africana (strain ATCC 22294 / BCRC 22015 / CBS 2517 / CECT 1963 / NBRC 1671 / NRRL Y-8276) TaxID=1071382 RepID=H2ANH3_KAZAF|nr:hypothetical protein KAFR_0A04870 [Kazachstania africana CBS 2517]CCF55923.1 hypothetical protein KAFR_0A04870 [Kazachstania africana CBS 2517]